MAQVLCSPPENRLDFQCGSNSRPSGALPPQWWWGCSLHSSAQALSKKNKGKQPQQQVDVTYSPAQLGAIEARLDLLAHFGYTVIALNQTVQTAIGPKVHVDILDNLVAQLKPCPGVVLLKRLTIILDQDSEKGFGLTPANAALFKPYDLIALVPTTQPTFSLACLTHSQPSVLTAHIISLPLTLRLDFRMKHTLVRTALISGVGFEISYVGALAGDNDSTLVEAGAAESGASAQRNWLGMIVSGGVVTEADFRSPRDVSNLITLLGLSQDVSRSASTKIPKSLVLRAQTRQTYRAVFSEPVLVVPGATTTNQDTPQSASRDSDSRAKGSDKKRPREEVGDGVTPQKDGTAVSDPAESSSRKKKRKKTNQEAR
ncbi:PHP domain-like protein [Mycena maculata]|uniref:PHP domain-like protein n=1 Tax=Mycena maculata TaxID=230809 RepID=A0AAD7JEC5_9AGAR|nr:PHP domain-like protein [Mycena maculata]